MAEHAARIGERIRALREAAGISQRELAERLPGRSTNQDVSRWERGLHRPSDDTLQHIAEALNTTLADLLVTTSPKTETPDLLRMGDMEKVARELAALSRKIDAVDERRQDMADRIGTLLERQSTVLSRIETLVLALPADEATMRLLQALKVEDLPQPQERPAGGAAEPSRPPRRRASG